MKYKTSILIEILVLVVGLAIVGTTVIKAKSKERTALLFPPQDLKYFTLGFSESVADILWLRDIQDFELCGAATEVSRDSAAKCLKGWSYRMLDTIVELAPRFKMPYISGGTVLSIIARDHEGAASIFKRGVERFPDDWQMAYRAGFHFMDAMKDNQMASDYLLLAAKKGAPGWVFALAARLKTKLGQAIYAKSILEEVIKTDPESRWAKRLQQRLDEIEEVIRKGE